MVDDKYYLSTKMVDYITKGNWVADRSVINPDICNTLVTVIYKMQRMTVQTYVSDDRRQLTAKEIRRELDLD